MESTQARRPVSRGRAPGLYFLLLALTLAINSVAVWGIFSGRRAVERAAQSELELATNADARSLEAVLGTLRGDLLFLARSPPLARYFNAAGDRDPMVRRWSRLDVESTLLLFLAANPAVERLAVEESGGSARVLASRRRGVPELLPLDAPLPTAGLLIGQWSLAGDQDRRLRAWVEPARLLALLGPARGGRLHLDTTAEALPPTPEPGQLLARAVVADGAWTPAIRWTLHRLEADSEAIRSFKALAGRYRLTVGLNLLVIGLTLLLGALAWRQLRRSARLEAENAQEKRVRELERQLMHSERLASVGRLAAGMAHEINNPLEGMSNYLRLLEDDLAAGDLSEAPELASRLREGLERAAGITRQVLAFSDPGRAPKTAVDLVGVVAETVAFLRADAGPRPVVVEWQPPAEAVRVMGNSVTLGQLVFNLLLNARQAEPAAGRVEVRLDCEPLTAMARLVVADRGPGISSAARGHLFEPFFSEKGSSGLGLAVCHSIVTDHGGEISGANRPQGGAEFEVSMPLLTAEQPPRQEEGSA